jgi:hypothetical protein
MILWLLRARGIELRTHITADIGYEEILVDRRKRSTAISAT